MPFQSSPAGAMPFSLSCSRSCRTTTFFLVSSVRIERNCFVFSSLALSSACASSTCIESSWMRDWASRSSPMSASTPEPCCGACAAAARSAARSASRAMMVALSMAGSSLLSGALRAASSCAVTSVFSRRICVHFTCSFWNLSVSSSLACFCACSSSITFGSDTVAPSVGSALAKSPCSLGTPARSLSCGATPEPCTLCSHACTPAIRLRSSVAERSAFSVMPAFSACSSTCFMSSTELAAVNCRSFLTVVRTTASSPLISASTSSRVYWSSNSRLCSSSLNSAATSETHCSRLRRRKRR
mmetsp:Transcript_31634/g.74712  ORF Transcript_31634/g.74712 Transcript_31634/m.74712 type:complete len:300 (-) Transcript_31634:121-1020(-)